MQKLNKKLFRAEQVLEAYSCRCITACTCTCDDVASNSYFVFFGGTGSNSGSVFIGGPGVPTAAAEPGGLCTYLMR